MPRISKKKIGGKKKTPKEVRTKLKRRASKTHVGDGPPIDREGAEGEFTLRLVEGKIKLYAKFRRKWYSVELS